MNFQYFNKIDFTAREINPLLQSSDYSERKLAELKATLNEKISPLSITGKFCILAVGSYGRKEASSESDLDGYVIHDKTFLEEKISLISFCCG